MPLKSYSTFDGKTHTYTQKTHTHLKKLKNKFLKKDGRIDLTILTLSNNIIHLLTSQGS